MLFDASVYEACELVEQTVEKLHEAIECCDFEDDKERIKQIIYDLNLLHEKLV